MKRFSTGIKIIVTALLLFFVFRSVDISKIRHDLGSLDAGRLMIFVFAFWIGQVLCSQRWRLLAGSLNMRAPYFRFVQMYSVGTFFNIGLPSLVGGDVVKAYMLSRENSRPLQFGLASVLQDRATGMISLFVYGTAASLLLPLSWRGIPFWFLYACIWLGIFAAVYLIWKGDRIFPKLLPPLISSSLHKIRGPLVDFRKSLVTAHLPGKAILQIAAWSLLNSALVLWMFQQLSAAAQHPVDLVAFSVLYPLISLITMLPISLGGLGIREWAYVEALSLVGIPRSGALLIALTTSALIILCSLTAALLILTLPGKAKLRNHARTQN